MINKQFGIKHCNAVVADYEKIKNTCPCMRCLCARPDCTRCGIWDEIIKGTSKYYDTLCTKCEFYNGR